MTDLVPRRFTFAAPPNATAWIGDALRRIFACTNRIPGPLARLIERLDRV
ncbi:MAG: hypothetical protein KF780_10530 [Sphingomonas sp.]|nr:hypothetical protein [Sphingomonas sp.]